MYSDDAEVILIVASAGRAQPDDRRIVKAVFRWHP
jgi:hypothetical protein